MQVNKYTKFSPSTNTKLYDVDIMSREQVNVVCEKAKCAFESWKKTHITERKKYLNNLLNLIRKNSDRIIHTIMRDISKPFCEAETEVIEGCDILEYFISENYDGIESPVEIQLNEVTWPNKKAYGLYQPSGVYAVIKPWNYPFELALWAVTPLLLAGNTLVYKPSELSSATGILLGELIYEAGFPDGVFNVIQGDGSTGLYLIKNPNIAGISFTGSTKAGSEIFNANKNIGVHLSMELGGSDFALVLDDAMEEITIPGIIWGSFSNAGQVCVAIEKVLIAESIYESFVQKVINETKKLELGKEISPIISQKHFLKAKNLIEDAINHGGRVLCGGIPSYDSNWSKGNYMLPTIIECKNVEYLSNLEEIFAPIVFVTPFSNEVEAINIVNASQYGLGCSIWTSDTKKHSTLYRDLDVGMVWVNEVNLPMPQVPWIGRKKSGVGYNLSKNAVYDSMNLKTLHIDGNNEKRVWWYPYIY